jgi:excisionase family DNA binding protein
MIKDRMPTKRSFYTTREAAEAVGISRATLQEWIATKQVEAPELPAPGLGVRQWTEEQLKQVKAYKERVYRKGRGEARRNTVTLVEGNVKSKETVWKLNEKARELTDGTRVFQYHPAGTYPPGARSKIVPIAWQEKMPGGRLVDVTNPKTLQFLNTSFRFIFGRLNRR